MLGQSGSATQPKGRIAPHKPGPQRRGVSALSFSFLGVPVTVRCSDPSLRRLFLACYGPRSRAGRRPLRYAVTRARGVERFILTGPGDHHWRPRGDGDLLYFLDGDLSIQLQKRRPDLYFLHSAVLGRHGLAALLVGPSGVGKSTAAWALSHHGFDFKGDELAPIDVETRTITRPFRIRWRASAGSPSWNRTSRRA